MTRCTLLPCGDYVVLQATAVPQAGKIVLLSQEQPNRGIVAACGPDVEELEEGFLVLHRPYAVTKVTVGAEEWTLVREVDVVARLAV